MVGRRDAARRRRARHTIDGSVLTYAALASLALAQWPPWHHCWHARRGDDAAGTCREHGPRCRRCSASDQSPASGHRTASSTTTDSVRPAPASPGPSTYTVLLVRTTNCSLTCGSCFTCQKCVRSSHQSKQPPSSVMCGFDFVQADYTLWTTRPTRWPQSVWRPGAATNLSLCTGPTLTRPSTVSNRFRSFGLPPYTCRVRCLFCKVDVCSG